MNRIVRISAIVVGAFALAVVASAALVGLNRMPAAIAERMPFVDTFTVEGDVRMTDGESLPTSDVAVSVQSPTGKTVRAKATSKRNYHYSATFMGFSAPVRPGDNLRVRAVLTPPSAKSQKKKAGDEKTPATEDTPKADDAAKTAETNAPPTTTTLDAPKESGSVLLADFEVVVGGDANAGEPGDLPTRLRAVPGASEPSTEAEWAELPLASLDSLPNLQLDEKVSLSAEVYETKRSPNDTPITPALPSAADESALRATPLASIGEELARSSFPWMKKRPAIPRSYTVSRAGVVSLQILDAAGVAVRREQRKATEGKFPLPQTWEWDGKDESGNYPPEGTYTFVASLDSMNLAPTPSAFVVETVQDGAPVQRYIELALSDTVGDLVDRCGVAVRKDRKGNFEFVSSVQLFRATLADKPERSSAIFGGNDTVGAVVKRFGLRIDTIPESTTHVAKYRLVVRGGTLRGKPTPNELRALTSAETQSDFLSLPLSHVVTADKGEPLVPDFQAEYTVTREVAPQSPEWGDRSSRQAATVVATPSTTVQGLIDQLNQIEGVAATIRGSSTSSYHYGARLVAPNGGKLRWTRGEDSAPTGANRLVANIRAAGVYAQVAPSQVIPIGDGVTSVPIEARVIGLDGKELANDTVNGTATQGSLANGGFFQPSNGVYLAEYMPPVTAVSLQATVEVVSRALSGQSAGDGGASVADRQIVVVDVAGFGGAPPVAAPTTNATARVAPVASAETPASPAPATDKPETNAPTPEAPETTIPPTPEPTIASLAPPVTTPTGLSPDDVRKLAKVYSRMSPKRASELLLSLSTDQARSVLLTMKDRDAAKIFDAILGSSEDEEEDISDDPATARERETRKQSLLDILEGKRKSGK